MFGGLGSTITEVVTSTTPKKVLYLARLLQAEREERFNDGLTGRKAVAPARCQPKLGRIRAAVRTLKLQAL